jgi:hypothetical protein
MHCALGILEMYSTPFAECFEVRDESPAIGRDLVSNAGRHRGFFEADQDTVGDKIFQVTNQHSLCDSGYAAT